MTEFSNIALHVEALIFASDKPLSSSEITELINSAFAFLEQSFSEEQIEDIIKTIEAKYASPDAAFTIKETGGGWQFLTKPAYHKTIVQLNGEKFLKRLSAAAMETLSIIAYKQPVTKGEIENIRGVNSDYSIQKLLEKELIIISGRHEEMPGKPLLYATSRQFMDYFGMNSVADLPKIKEVLAGQTVEPTVVSEEKTTGESLVVNNEGALISAQNNTVGIDENLNE